jgi:hypothetical protein
MSLRRIVQPTENNQPAPVSTSGLVLAPGFHDFLVILICLFIFFIKSPTESVRG